MGSTVLLATYMVWMELVVDWWVAEGLLELLLRGKSFENKLGITPFDWQVDSKENEIEAVLGYLWSGAADAACNR